MCTHFSVSSDTAQTKSFSCFCAWTFEELSNWPLNSNCAQFQAMLFTAAREVFQKCQSDVGIFWVTNLQGLPTAFTVDSRPFLRAHQALQDLLVPVPPSSSLTTSGYTAFLSAPQTHQAFSTSTSLHVLFPLPGTLFSKSFAQPAPSQPPVSMSWPWRDLP